MIRWGFIGCGDVVEKKSGKPFNLQGKSEVTAVMCRNIDKAKSFAQRHGIKEYYDDADKIILNKNVDAIYIATTPDSHMPYAKRAIEAGKPVYVEKPMGLNTAECEEVMELAKKKNVPLFVAFYRRGLPFFTHIKKIIDTGEIGGIRCVNIVQYKKKPVEIKPDWRRDVAVAGGGLFHDLGCHTLDIIDFLVSPITEVNGFKCNNRKLYDSDDTVSCSFMFENGAMGTGLWCFDTNTEIDRVEIIGNSGKLEFPVFGNTLTITKSGETTQTQIANPSFVQQPLIHNVIASLLGESSALSTAETAIRTARVMDKI